MNPLFEEIRTTAHLQEGMTPKIAPVSLKNTSFISSERFYFILRHTHRNVSIPITTNNQVTIVCIRLINSQNKTKIIEFFLISQMKLPITINQLAAEDKNISEMYASRLSVLEALRRTISRVNHNLILLSQKKRTL